MYRIEIIPIKVKCPGHPLRKVVSMEMRMSYSDQHRPVPAPCNGCDDMNGMMPCQECCAAITKLFFENPGYYPDPIDPLRLPTKQS